ncbi:MAG: OmpH family outer membrane protein [Gemmataceae bacterium]
MKRFAGLTTSVLALGLMFSVVSTSWAQNGTRVGIVNMDIILKNYKKVQFFKTELKNVAEPYREKVKKYEDYYKRWKEIEGNPQKSKKERTDANKQAVLWKRKIEDLTNEANKKIMDMGQNNLVRLYRDLETVIAGYAKANGYHLVCHHFDPVDPKQKYSWANLDRRLNRPMQAGSMSPIYVSNAIDISNDVLSILNRQYPDDKNAQGQ